MFLVACDSPAPYYPSGDDSDGSKTYLKTGSYSDLTHNSVVVYAETNLDESNYESVEYGFVYSTNKDDIEYSNDIVWADNGERDEDVYSYSATISNLTADEQYYYCAMVRLNETECKYGKIEEFTTTAMPDDPNPNDLPMLESPGYGKVTIALRASAATCNGMIAVGAATNWDGTDDWDPSAQNKRFTKVEDTENWYQITLPANPDMSVKVIAVTLEGIADWGTQWGRNVNGEEPSVVLLKGDGYLDNFENNGEVRLMELVENTVVYVDVLAWQSDPCIEKNAEGWATFRVIVPDNTPINAQVSIAGSFYENTWTPGAYLLERQSDGTYYGEFYIPAAFQYKYIVGFAGMEWSWEYVEVSENRVMPLDMHAYDVVEMWFNIPDPNPSNHEWVDLGLPSGLKWATCNVGASQPEEYGNYFAWGEVEPKEHYYWESYKWPDGGYYKYCTNSDYGYVDNKTTLELSDDAANYNWGGGWRMPTYEEQAELRNNCSWEWITQNGVNGYTVTGPNGNSIFLPAAGYRYDSSLNYAGSYGNYWSSSLDTYNSSNACGLGIYSDYAVWECGNRCYGHSVRPVCQ